MPITSSLQGGGAVRGGGGGGGANILLLITAVNNASNTLSKVAKDIGGLDKATANSGKNAEQAKSGFDNLFSGLQSGVSKVAGVIGALYGLERGVEAFLAIGERGAAFTQTAQSFNQMMDYMNVAPDVLQKLRDASQGTISDLQLMSYATTALAGSSGQFGAELANALPHILEIAKAANKANPALGSVDYQFQSLIIGLKRLSPRLIDNTGLQVKLGESYEKLAKSMGKSREELTAEEQQLALLNATLDAGDRLLDQVGNTAESLTDPFGRLRAETANLGDAFATLFAPAAGGVADFFADIMRGASSARVAMVETGAIVKANNDEFARSSPIYADYVSKVIDTTLANGNFSKGMINVYEKMREAAYAGKDLTNVWEVLGTTGALAAGYGYTQIYDALNLLDKSQHALLTTEDDRRESIKALRVANSGLLLAEIQNELQAEKTKQEYNELKESMEGVHLAMSGWVSETGADYQSKVQEITDDISKYENELRVIAGVKAFSPEQTDEIIRISDEMSVLTERAAFIKDALDDGLIPKDQTEFAKEELALINEQMDAYSEELQTITGLPFVTDEQLSKIGELAQKIRDSKDALGENEEALKKNTKEMTYNIAEGMIMDAMQKGLIKDVNDSGTAYDEAFGALTKLGEQFGLIDKDTALYQEAVVNATEAVINGSTSVDSWTGALDGVSGALSSAMSEAGSLQGALEKLPKEIQILIRITTVGSIPTYNQYGDDEGYIYEGPGHQFGGRVTKGRVERVGEGGEELFVPPVSGTILPNSFVEMLTQGMGGGGSTVTVNFYGTQVRGQDDIDMIAMRVSRVISQRNR